MDKSAAVHLAAEVTLADHAILSMNWHVKAVTTLPPNARGGTRLPLWASRATAMGWAFGLRKSLALATV